MTFEIERRTFLKTSIFGFTGLTIGCSLGSSNDDSTDAGPAASADLSIWVNIAEDNQVKIVVVRSEMGQGITTAMPMIIADELEANWEDVVIEMMPEIDDFGMMPTAGSLSIRMNYGIARGIGAAAREMLIAAAAERFGVSAKTLTAENGQVVHA